LNKQISSITLVSCSARLNKRKQKIKSNVQKYSRASSMFRNLSSSLDLSNIFNITYTYLKHISPPLSSFFLTYPHMWNIKAQTTILSQQKYLKVYQNFFIYLNKTTQTSKIVQNFAKGITDYKVKCLPEIWRHTTKN
jgi:hypothetical protein